jgi:hypothetical protein
MVKVCRIYGCATRPTEGHRYFHKADRDGLALARLTPSAHCSFQKRSMAVTPTAH